MGLTMASGETLAHSSTPALADRTHRIGSGRTVNVDRDAAVLVEPPKRLAADGWDGCECRADPYRSPSHDIELVWASRRP